MKFQNEFAAFIYTWLTKNGVPDSVAIYVKLAILLAAIAFLAFIADFIVKRFLLVTIKGLTAKTKTKFDDYMVENKVFDAIAHIAPALVIEFTTDFIGLDFPALADPINRITSVFIVFVVMRAISATLSALRQYLNDFTLLKDKPIDSYIQLARILLYSIAVILMVSILFDKSPLYFFSALGAVSAVLILVFKDTILGFVASIQLASNDMVRIGDWVTVTKYGADGDVIEINLATIKVRNWDNTITTIPTYAFISDSFTNWRGMTQSGGRRIKRAINVDINSIKFCSQELLEKLKTYTLLTDYINQKQAEISSHNAKYQLDESILVNGRNLTNIGVFRVYVENYLKQNKHINQEMTLMVRQLAPTELGLPLEIYCFSASKEWVIYEGIMSDIFDHLLAAIRKFELEVFQSPSGRDFQQLNK